jgi:hypothetical protein
MLVTGFKVTDASLILHWQALRLAWLELVNLMYHLLVCTASAIGPVVALKLQKSPVRENDVVCYLLVIYPTPKLI